jgi:hypothetical protein
MNGVTNYITERPWRDVITKTVTHLGQALGVLVRPLVVPNLKRSHSRRDFKLRREQLL